MLNFNCVLVPYTNELLILTSLLIADRLITKSCLDCSDNRKFVIMAWLLRGLKTSNSFVVGKYHITTIKILGIGSREVGVGQLEFSGPCSRATL